VAVSKPKKKAGHDLDAWIPYDPNRVYYTAIRNAFIERFTQWYHLPSEAAPSGEGLRLEKEWSELIPLLSRHPPTNSKHDWRELPKQPQILRVLRQVWRLVADRKPRGRPLKLRPLAVEALDLQRTDPKRWTWRALAGHLCNCGLAEHGSNCQQNLRREALLVKQFLRARRIKLDSPPAK
jgi:hypothetical protein